jgi:VCBS repeat-containing protein
MNYRLTTDGVLGDAAVATVRLRIGTTGTITTVDQVTGKNKDTGWKTATYTFAVTAGNQTLQFGATAANNNVTGSTIRAYFDNIRVEPAGNTGVLANDTGGAVSATLNTPPANGTLLFNVNGTFTYTPKANFSGADSFTYVASDGATTSNVGTVSLTVNAVNDAPVAVANSYTTTESVTLNVPANQGVLINDTDVEGQALTAALVAQATRGTVTLNANGSFSYVPNPGISGSDSFTYRASDGTANSNTVASPSPSFRSMIRRLRSTIATPRRRIRF